MQQIAIIADIHANYFALQAVIADIEAHQVDEVLVAGDLVGRGPQGSAVVQEIAERGWASARGNHEDYLLGFINRDVPDLWWEADEWAASRWMARELDKPSQEFIDALPFSIHSEIDPMIQVFHGSPFSHSEGIGSWTSEDRFREYLDAIDGNILICSHTHRPMLYDGPGGLIVNVGSVGMPFNGDWRAQYVILSGEPGDWTVTFRQVEYPRDQFLAHYERSGFLDEGGVTAHLLRREIQRARPFLMPFLKWAELTEQAPSIENLPEFFATFGEVQSTAEFIDRLQELKRQSHH